MRYYRLIVKSRNGGKLAKALQVLQIMDLLESVEMDVVTEED